MLGDRALGDVDCLIGKTSSLGEADGSWPSVLRSLKEGNQGEENHS